jgi:hypothetical protein
MSAPLARAPGIQHGAPPLVTTAGSESRRGDSRLGHARGAGLRVLSKHAELLMSSVYTSSGYRQTRCPIAAMHACMYDPPRGITSGA